MSLYFFSTIYFVKSKHKSGVSDRNLASDLDCVLSIKYSEDFETEFCILFFFMLYH